MFSHVMVGTNDIGRAQRFYDAVLGTLGAGAAARNVAGGGHVRLFYRHDGGLFAVTQPIDGEPATVANGATIGFRCGSSEQVDAFHAAALAHGGQAIEDPPGVRAGGSYYIAYVRDPDGHKLCAIHHLPRRG
jgi:catechol 2,3-dioxygenase-like lactoylglutathione lyase family enzyme